MPSRRQIAGLARPKQIRAALAGAFRGLGEAPLGHVGVVAGEEDGGGEGQALEDFRRA